MGLLILGVALWWAAHFFKRVAPGARERLDPGKGLVAVALMVSIVLMVMGYRFAEGTVFWGRTSGMTHLNNLLMLIAVYFMSPGPSKGAIFYKMRHPMLVGFVLFCVAHLLVNGDTPSFILFGGLGLWALLSIVVINRAEPNWTPHPKGTIAKDAMFVAASVVLLAVLGLIHGWLGPMPFGG